MLRLLGAVALACVLASTAAEARPAKKHPRPDSQAASHCEFTNGGRVVCPVTANRISGHARVRDANGNRAVVVGGRPSGCPHAFCGCEASLYLFGEIRKRLNLAANWLDFPRTHAAPGMAAVRKHHVMVLMRHIEGHHWLVHDGNSGGHKTREHVRSIAGYVVVDPRARTASND